MTQLESNRITINKPVTEVYQFLSLVSNHEQLMPDQVSDWMSEGDTCQYTIKGTGSVSLKVKQRIPDTSISFEPNGRIPFPFEVIWNLENQGGQTAVKVIMYAELNPILKMVASGPLKNFINLQINALKNTLDGQ